MLEPHDVRGIVVDAARLAGQGEIVVFGSASLAFWLESAPATRDVDLYCLPERTGQPIEALMGELSWYHERHGVYVEVWAPETFRTAENWRNRAKEVRFDEAPDVTVVVPHPHDVVLAELERCDERDREHILTILAEYPLSAEELARRRRSTPHECGEIRDSGRVARFRQWAEWLRNVVQD